MTTETTTTGYVLVIGAGLFLLGVVVVMYVRSERAEKRELARKNRELRLANARLTNHPATRTSDFDTHWSSAIRDHTEQAQARLTVPSRDAEVIDLQEAIADAFNRVARSASQKGGR